VSTSGDQQRDNESRQSWFVGSELMSDLTTAKARPGIDNRARRRRRWDKYAPLLVPAVVIAVVIAVIAVIATRKAPESEQFTLRMRSSAPLSMATCSAEIARYGWNVQGGPPVICRAGQGRTWYRATLVNRGGQAYPACQATGFDARGKVVFSGPVYFLFRGLPAGLDAKGHTATAFTWYLPKKSAPAARYVASCVVDEHPPI
jgi:hypothetical protein